MPENNNNNAQDEESGVVYGSDTVVGSKLDFNKLVFMAVNRIGYWKSQIGYGGDSIYVNQVEYLQDLLSGHIDQMYEHEIRELVDIYGPQYIKAINLQDAFTANQIRLMMYRHIFKVCVRLARRRNITPEFGFVDQIT